MKLFTKAIEKKLQAQYNMGNSPEQMVVCKIFHPFSYWAWYILNQDPKDPDYLWAIVDGNAVEMGSVSKHELEEGTIRGLHFERDLHFGQIKAEELWNKLIKEE